MVSHSGSIVAGLQSVARPGLAHSICLPLTSILFLVNILIRTRSRHGDDAKLVPNDFSTSSSELSVQLTPVRDYLLHVNP